METVNPITPDLMNQALTEAHDTCKDECIHADALAANEERAKQLVALLAKREIKEGRNPLFGSFFFGIHVGYRFAQLVAAPIDTAKVN